MFTGIIEEKGTVKEIRKGAKSSQLTIEGGIIFDDIKTGDSIAVNGVCLTAAGLSKNTFTADVMHETLNRSTLSGLRPQSRVNLERAMTADGRFGGHIVSGHIDGVGEITKVQRDDNAVWYTIRADKKIMRYIVEKGSVAIDGISLTVAKAGDADFCVSVIPHTLKATVLGERSAGSKVNLENDIIGKYVERFLSLDKPQDFKIGHGSQNGQESPKSCESVITKEYLARLGY